MFARQSIQLRRITLLALAFIATPALAHDFWIEAAPFHPAPAQRVALRLFVGQDFAGEPIPYLPPLFERFVRRGPDGEHAITGTAGDDPAVQFTPAAGLTVIGLQTRPQEVSFDNAAEFESYLRTEGLERHLLATARRARDKPIRETYYRCAKALIVSRSSADPRHDHALGLPLELVNESAPAAGQPLRLQLLHRGKPLEGALVVLSRKAKPMEKLRARTDAAGRVSFVLPARGMWLATSVHMLPAPFYTKEDWRSVWASLSFEIR
jgi:uncharacterized GH25 family protein